MKRRTFRWGMRTNYHAMAAHFASSALFGSAAMSKDATPRERVYAAFKALEQTAFGMASIAPRLTHLHSWRDR